MDNKEKSAAKIKLGLAIQKIIETNKNSKNTNTVSSLRQLAASSGVEYAIIQRISSGQKDPQFTTLVSIAEGLGMSITELFSYYEQITDQSVLKKKKNK